VSGVDQAEHPVLHEIPDVDRVRHRRRHTARERFHEPDAGLDPLPLMSRQGRAMHIVRSLLRTFRPRLIGPVKARALTGSYAKGNGNTRRVAAKSGSGHCLVSC